MAKSTAVWWVHISGEPQGPFDLGYLKKALKSGDIDRATPAWTDAWEQWDRAANIDGLFENDTPPPARRQAPRKRSWLATSILLCSVFVAVVAVALVGAAASYFVNSVRQERQLAEIREDRAALRQRFDQQTTEQQQKIVELTRANTQAENQISLLGRDVNKLNRQLFQTQQALDRERKKNKPPAESPIRAKAEDASLELLLQVQENPAAFLNKKLTADAYFGNGVAFLARNSTEPSPFYLVQITAGSKQPGRGFGSMHRLSASQLNIIIRNKAIGRRELIRSSAIYYWKNPRRFTFTIEKVETKTVDPLLARTAAHVFLLVIDKIALR